MKQANTTSGDMRKIQKISILQFSSTNILRTLRSLENWGKKSLKRALRKRLSDSDQRFKCKFTSDRVTSQISRLKFEKKNQVV